MHFYEGQIGLQTWFGHQFLAFPDALGLGLVEAVDDVAHFGQVAGVEDSCLEPRPSSRHNWFWRERQLGAALVVGLATGWSLDEDHFDRRDQPVHIREEVLHFLTDSEKKKNASLNHVKCNFSHIWGAKR